MTGRIPVPAKRSRSELERENEALLAAHREYLAAWIEHRDAVFTQRRREQMDNGNRPWGGGHAETDSSRKTP